MFTSLALATVQNAILILVLIITTMISYYTNVAMPSHEAIEVMFNMIK